MNIYSVLSTRLHNPHYLQRYVKFIEYCQTANIQLSKDTYTEEHHICPKSPDMFPEYKDLKEHTWNSLRVTARQHFICHWLLWKTFGCSQTYSFETMCRGRHNKTQKRYSKINSRTFELLKSNSRDYKRELNKGMSTYIDSNGNKVWCRTDDPRVLSGELVSASKGRRYKSRTSESRDRTSVSLIDAKWLKYPIRKVDLYFLDTKITLEYTRENFTFIPYVEQGWSLGRATPEYKSMCSARSNRNRSR